MFKVDVVGISAEVVSADQVGIKNPADLKKALSISQMKAFSEKYLGKIPEKGSTKDAVAIELFKAIAANLGYTPEEIEAGVAYVYPEVEKAEKPAKEKKVREPKGPRTVTVKSFGLANGSTPVAAEGQKVLWNEHAIVFAEAIVALIGEGKSVASRDELVKKAEELKILERKKTNQDVGQLFSFWRQKLVDAGYLTVVEVKKEVAPAEPAVA